MSTLVGIDEVGRGCWAGPLLVVAARQVGILPSGLTDSKLLTKRKRETLMDDISISCQLGEGWVEPEEIDRHGLTEAMRMGVKRALDQLGISDDTQIIMDGTINYCPVNFINVRTIAKADLSQPIVSAASIHAKVRRDDYMTDISDSYPEYQFDKHVGYGTKLHIEMLKLHGTCVLHRLSYKPIKKLQTIT